MKIKKKIIIEVDGNKKANLLVQDDMKPMEVINILISAAICHYKEALGITSIDEAAQVVGRKILKRVAQR